jgi:hypothetical protein
MTVAQKSFGFIFNQMVLDRVMVVAESGQEIAIKPPQGNFVEAF